MERGRLMPAGLEKWRAAATRHGGEVAAPACTV